MSNDIVKDLRRLLLKKPGIILDLLEDAVLRAAARADIAEAEAAKLRMILAARDAYDRGEPSQPPVTGMAKRALGEAKVSHVQEVMGHLDDETQQNKASENDGGRSGGHTTIAGNR